MNYCAMVITPLTKQDQFESFAKRFEGIEEFLHTPKLSAPNRTMKGVLSFIVWLSGYKGEVYSIYSMTFDNNRLTLLCGVVPPMDLIKQFSAEFKDMEIKMSWITEGNGHGTHYFINGEIVKVDSTIQYEDYIRCQKEFYDAYDPEESFQEMLDDYRIDEPSMTMEEMLKREGILGGPARESFF